MSLLSEDREPFRLPAMQGMSDQDETDLFAFSGSVGPNGENRREDVIRAQTLLARTGDFDPDGIFGMPTGWPSSDLYRGIKKFQKRNGKEADGTLLPLPPGGVDQYGVGETIDALRGELGEHVAGQKAWTPDEVDAHYERAARSSNTAGEEPSGKSSEGTGKTTGRVLSDVPDASQPVWQDGGQSAQMAPLQQQLMQQAGQATQRLLGLPPIPGPGNPPRDQYGVSDDEKKVAGELLRRGTEAINLLNVAPQLVGKVMRDPQAFLPADKMPTTPPSEPISDSDKAAAQTPPLAPPEVNAKLQGRPAEEREPTVEKLIPPEMKEWYEGLEPFDQELAKELMLVFNKGGRKGQEATRLGNADTVKEILRFLQKERQMGTNVTHAHGSRRNGEEDGPEKPEEYLRGRDSDGTRGASWPDGSIRYANPTARDTAEEFLRFFSGKTLADGVTGVKSERDQIARAEYNRPGEMMVFVPKLLPDLPDGKISPERRKEHQEEVRKITRSIGLRFEDFLKSKGKL